MHQLPGAQGAPYGLFAGLSYRGHSREDWAREYLQVYPPIDERVPRLGQLPARRHLLPLASDVPEAITRQADVIRLELSLAEVG